MFIGTLEKKKLEPDKLPKEFHERVCITSPCKSKELHAQPRSPFKSYIPKTWLPLEPYNSFVFDGFS